MATNTLLQNPFKWQKEMHREVQPDDLVLNQVDKVIDKGGPLMQRAETLGLQMSNDRGLLNSSMAVGEAQNQVFNVAIPIATADANTHFSQGINNQNATNQMRAINNQGYVGAAHQIQAFQHNLAIVREQNAHAASMMHEQFSMAMEGQYRDAFLQISTNPHMTPAQQQEGIRTLNSLFGRAPAYSANFVQSSVGSAGVPATRTASITQSVSAAAPHHSLR